MRVHQCTEAFSNTIYTHPSYHQAAPCASKIVSAIRLLDNHEGLAVAEHKAVPASAVETCKCKRHKFVGKRAENA